MAWALSVDDVNLDWPKRTPDRSDRMAARELSASADVGVAEAFCPTGDGGGVKNDCEPANKGQRNPLRFKVRGKGEWVWDGYPPEKKGPMGGDPHYRVKRVADGATGELMDWGGSGWRIRLDSAPRYEYEAQGDGKSPLGTAIDKAAKVQQHAKEGDPAAGKAGAKRALELWDAAGRDSEHKPETTAGREEWDRTVAEGRKVFERVLHTYGDKAKERIGEVTSITLFPNAEALNAHLGTKRVAGVYRHSDTSGAFLLTHAGLEEPDRVYGHEMAHAVDGPASDYSSDRKWKSAWKSEIGSKKETPVSRVMLEDGTIKELEGKIGLEAGDHIYLGEGKTAKVESAVMERRGRMGNVLVVKYVGNDEKRMFDPKAAFYPVGAPEAPAAPLSRYAQTSPSEGFAEFGALLLQDTKAAKERFPKCYGAWKQWKLVEDAT